MVGGRVAGRWSRARTASFGVAAVVAACTTDHSILARRDRPGAGGAAGAGAGGGGAGATSPDAGGATGDSGLDSAADAPADAPPADGPADAGGDGPDLLTVLNGVPDADRVAVCFVRVTGGVGAPVGWPLVIDYASTRAYSSVEGLDFAADDLRLVVFRGDLTLLGGRDCAASLARVEALTGAEIALEGTAADAGPEGSTDPPDAADAADGETAAEPAPDAPAEGGSDAASEAGLDAADAADASGDAADASGDAAGTDASSDAAGEDGGPDAPPDAAEDAPAADAPPEGASDGPGDPPIRALPLPVLPAGTVAGGRHVLVVITGCFPGAEHSGGVELSVCGDAYTPLTPTLGAIAVRLARRAPGAGAGLQVLHATRGSVVEHDFRVQPPADAGGEVVTLATAVGYGVLAPREPTGARSAAEHGWPLGTVEVLQSNSGAPSLAVAWSEIQAGSGGVGLVDGANRALVLVGPRPSLAPGGWWQAPRLVLVQP
ncbi:MAG: hypothetical protein IT376_12920 [Polyangiaceae bacterium]|nr:hypothetical protein [Polyangiaceae bacterium]